MQKQSLFASLTKYITCAALVAAFITPVMAADEKKAETKKADPTGTWTWTQQPRQGGNAPANATPRKSTLKLKAEGEKLTGTLSQPAFARRGQGADAAAAAPAPVETAITNGKIKGDEISFDVTRDRGGNSFTTKYSGKVEGDTIKGKSTFTGQNGEMTRDWEAKREEAKK
jgi:hypothetical protein